MPKCAPNYLSVIRSPGNRDQACRIGRPFKHQKGEQTSHDGGSGVGVAESDSQPSNGRAQFTPLWRCDAPFDKEDPYVTEADRTGEKLIFRFKSSDQSRQAWFYSSLPPALSGSQRQPGVCILLPPKFKGWVVNTGNKKPWMSVACRGRNSSPQSYLSCFYELLLHSCKRYGLRYLWCIQFCYHWFIERNQLRDMMERPWFQKLLRLGTKSIFCPVGLPQMTSRDKQRALHSLLQRAWWCEGINQTKADYYSVWERSNSTGIRTHTCLIYRRADKVLQLTVRRTWQLLELCG